MNKKIHWSIPLVDLEDSKLFLRILIAKSENNKIDLNKVKKTFEEQWPSKKNDDIVDFFTDINIISKNMTKINYDKLKKLINEKDPHIDIDENVRRIRGKLMNLSKERALLIVASKLGIEYRELVDKNISLKEDEILDYIVKKMYLDTIAFKLMIDILKNEGYLSKGKLKDKLTNQILEYAKKNNLEEYEKKQKKLKKHYKDISAWRYPEPSFNRFLRFAKGVGLVTINKRFVKLSEEKLNEILKEPKEFTYEEFEKEFYETYDQLCNMTNTIFQSIDKTRKRMCEKLGINEDLFNKYWIEVYERNPKKIQTFQSKIDENEKGLKMRDRLIFKYRIIGK